MMLPSIYLLGLNVVVLFKVLKTFLPNTKTSFQLSLCMFCLFFSRSEPCFYFYFRRHLQLAKLPVKCHQWSSLAHALLKVGEFKTLVLEALLGSGCRVITCKAKRVAAFVEQAPTSPEPWKN